MEYIGKTCAFTVIDDLSIMIHSADKPTAEEWSNHVRMVAEVVGRVGDNFKNLVFTDGAAPDRHQSAELNAAVEGRQTFPTAVVLESAVVRLAIAVLTLWKWKIKAFAPTEYDAIMKHLGIPVERRAETLESVRALSAKFRATSAVSRLLAASRSAA